MLVYQRVNHRCLLFILFFVRSGRTLLNPPGLPEKVISWKMAGKPTMVCMKFDDFRGQNLHWVSRGYTLWFKHTKNYGKSQFLMGKSTISMAMFNCKLLNYQRVYLPAGWTTEDGTGTQRMRRWSARGRPWHMPSAMPMSTPKHRPWYLGSSQAICWKNSHRKPLYHGAPFGKRVQFAIENGHRNCWFTH